MLRTEGLGFRFGGGDWLFRHLDLAVEAGEVMAILGPNGRGKTTLLKLLLGLITPREGRILRSGTVGYVPQSAAAGIAYPALDMVLMGRARQQGMFGQPGRQDRTKAEAALDRLGILDLADRPFDRLSGGQRQLVLLARALVSDCAILLLDEPASALDLKNQGLILRAIQGLAAERALAVLFTTHHPSHALEVADRVLLMQGAEEHRIGPAAEVLTDESLSRLYGVPVQSVAVETVHGRRYAVTALW